jgi:ABC-type branched-subunit amino acid transport system substrate-binding protein
MRQGVLANWPTGAEVDIDEAAAYHRSMSPAKTQPEPCARRACKARCWSSHVPASADVDAQIALLQRLRSAGAGADLLPTTVDSNTRERRYADAERGIAQSCEAGRSLLNGLPAVNHGLRECRRIADAVDAPLFARTASPDCRLTHEIMYGGGYTSCTAGAIVFSLGYAKDYLLAKAIEAWQYSYRMMGAYHERSVTLSVEHYLPISTLVPQSMSMACVLLDSLIAAAQGVRCISLGIGQQCHLAQDAAALRACAARGHRRADHRGQRAWPAGVENGPAHAVRPTALADRRDRRGAGDHRGRSRGDRRPRARTRRRRARGDSCRRSRSHRRAVLAAPCERQPGAAITRLRGAVRLAQFGELMFSGAALAVEHANADRMQSGKLTMAAEDTQGTPPLGVIGMNKLVSVEKVPYVLTSYTGVSKAVAPIAPRGKTVTVNGGGVGPDLAELGAYFWNVIPLANFEVKAFVPYLVKQRGFKRVTLVWLDDPLGNGLRKELEASLPAVGGQLVEARSVPVAAQQFSGVAERVRESKPDVVYIASCGAQQVSAIKQLRDNGVTQPLVSYGSVLQSGDSRAARIQGRAVHDPARRLAGERRGDQALRRRLQGQPRQAARRVHDQLLQHGAPVRAAGARPEEAGQADHRGEPVGAASVQSRPACATACTRWRTRTGCSPHCWPPRRRCCSGCCSTD